MVLGDFDAPNAYSSARGLVVTLLVNNHLNGSANEPAARWEAAFIELMRSVQGVHYTVSFMAERSLQVGL